MAGIKFFSENYIDNATLTLSSGGENAQFPLVNVNNASPSVKYRSTGSSVVIVAVLGQTRDIGAVAIAGDPSGTFVVASASVKLSVTDDFSESATINLDIGGAQSIGFATFAPQSRRFIQITLTGAEYVELGALFVGQLVELENQNLSIDSFAYGYKDLSQSSRNRYGQVFVDALPLLKSLSGELQYCTKSEQETLDDLFIWHGTKRPLWIVVDSEGVGMNDGEFKLTCYGYLQEVPVWSAASGQHYSCPITVEQAT